MQNNIIIQQQEHQLPNILVVDLENLLSNLNIEPVEPNSMNEIQYKRCSHVTLSLYLT